ncbi:predicted type I restriction-modification enzyme, subunit S [Methanothermobacter marburgensis str. Marburg]|uniref:Predicted type I restriction-modification enzyme, subunit S n=1 Tax=Methanothermobacter marburgensis (strain ATCC BAA-927 / DSM 2133 / JCM 14651 / NBRC 100331 / OCM 82 / Marburg) TaxID=79929 RepID=D9PXG7_METTM|nr:predicted type I restriction-modification enzyme, subunit S [Methanothermobacter marburgensis str. Marburg]
MGEVVDQRRESIQPAGEGKNNFVGLEHIRSGETKLCEYVSDEGIRSTKYRFYTGDILYGKLRPYLDKAVLADINGICSTDLIVLTPSDRIIPEFLIYFIHTNQFIQRAVSTTSGTNHPRTSWKAISKFRMALPPLEEQKRISEILQDVDGAIEKVNKEIGVTEKLKRGLMQRLLMEGINHTEFKDSPVGRIPVDWDVVKLGDLFTFKNGKRPPVLNEGEIPIYGANGKMGLTSNYLKTKDKALIFGRVGSSGEVHLSKGCVWVSDNAIYTESYDSKRVNVHFMFYLIKFKDLKRFATKTTHPIITQTFINNFKVPLPPLEEQKRISEILQDVDRRLELLTERKVKLENIKRGLMNDLLTGKRRVRITS